MVLNQILDSDPNISGLLEIAHQLADTAGEIALRYFRCRDVGLANKDVTGFDPVTRADREIETRLRQLLGELRPDDGILAEEFEAKPGRSPYTWVIDPIDGTRSFISGTPVWGILIAVNDGGSIVLGMIDQPFTGERFFGSGGKAFLTHRGETTPQFTRRCRGLGDAVLFTTFPEVGTSVECEAFRAVSRRTRLTRYGMDCYAYALLAGGHIDLVIEAGLNAYDIQGPTGVIEAAGGIVTDWRGRPVLDGGRVLAAGDARVHALALEVLRSSVDGENQGGRA
ncbi:MAG: inositol monophosphatase family protein [Paracoccaceae bacterium]|nr:inositol monophosphatase family protein [Paracoccaceae bacterium]